MESANSRNFSHVTQEEIADVDWLIRVSDYGLIWNYQNALTFDFPSLQEGFGFTPLETIACRRPVLLSRATSIPEVVGLDIDLADSSDSGTAPYFEPMGEADIAGVTEKAFRSDEDTMLRWRENVIDRASRFSWTAIAEKTEAILEML